MTYLLIIWSCLSARAEDSDTSSPSETEEASDLIEENNDSNERVTSTIGGELIIYGEQELARKRAILDQQLRDDGYTTVKKKDGRTVYRPDIAWKPSVVIYDEGYMIVRRSPVRFEPWIQGKKSNKLRYLSCIPPFTVLCVRSGWLVNERKLAHSKEAIVEASTPNFEAWQELVMAKATVNRLQNEIPDLLDGLWLNGRSLERSDVFLETAAARKAEMLSFWESRTCTPEGEQVRNFIEDYILQEIQNSEHAYLQSELEKLPQEACEIKLTERLTGNLK